MKMSVGRKSGAILATVAILLVSGCTAPDLRPPESERDDTAYVIRAERVDRPDDPSEEVHDYSALNASERVIVDEAIREGEYRECDDGGGVSDAVARLEERFQYGAGYVRRNGSYYDMYGSTWTDEC